MTNITSPQSAGAIDRMRPMAHAAARVAARLAILEAHETGGAYGALAALATQSVRQYYNAIRCGHDAEKARASLVAVADELQLAETWGQAAVDVALAAGPDTLDAIWAEYERGALQ